MNIKPDAVKALAQFALSAVKFLQETPANGAFAMYWYDQVNGAGSFHALGQIERMAVMEEQASGLEESRRVADALDLLIDTGPILPVPHIMIQQGEPGS